MPSGTVTLLEAAKTMDEGHARDVIGTYASTYQPFSVMPLQTALGGTYSWNVENELPYTSGGVRNVNGTWTSSRASISPYSDQIRIYGGQVQIDNVVDKINPAQTPRELNSQVKARARQFIKDMFEGSGGSALRGIKDYLDNETIFANQTTAANNNTGTASTGQLLITDDMDKLISLGNIVPGRSFIYCSDNVGLRIRKLSRGNNVTNDIAFANRFPPEMWGFFSGNYDSVPIVVLKDGKGTDLLSITDGDGSSSSVYLVTYGDEMFTGAHAFMPQVRSLSQADVYNYFNLEWPVLTAPQAIKCIARVRYVTNATA